MGLRDQLIFPEISYEKVDKIRGMNVTIVTTARSDDEARELLKQLGMPFRQHKRISSQERWIGPMAPEPE